MRFIFLPHTVFDPRSKSRIVPSFILGAAFGLTISILYCQVSKDVLPPNGRVDKHRFHDNPFSNKMHAMDDDELEEINLDMGMHQQHNHSLEDAHGLEDNTVKDNLYKEVRVLCWVMTTPKNHKTKAIHVKKTWGSRCNKFLLMSSVTDEEVGTIALNVSEGRENLWAKTREAFKYVYEHHFNDADWFYKADDDTYAIMENMRHLLYPYSKDIPIYFGYKFRPYVDQGYMSGGAGYVLSKEALRRYIEVALKNDTICKYNATNSEDVAMGKCLQNVDVIAGDSRDAAGRGRFFIFNPDYHLFPNSEKVDWYSKYQFYPGDDIGLASMSDNAIAFHYIKSYELYKLDYFIYHLRPYGIVPHPQELPRKLEPDEIMRNGTVIRNDVYDVFQDDKAETETPAPLIGSSSEPV